jgi:hypothetical protein
MHVMVFASIASRPASSLRGVLRLISSRPSQCPELNAIVPTQAAFYFLDRHLAMGGAAVLLSLCRNSVFDNKNLNFRT